MNMRFREEVGKSPDQETATKNTISRAGRTLLVSGVTTMLSSAALSVFPTTAYCPRSFPAGQLKTERMPDSWPRKPMLSWLSCRSIPALPPTIWLWNCTLRNSRGALEWFR